MELMHLDEAPRCVGKTDAKLAAVVQQIECSRRAVIGGKKRVATYYVLHLADPTRTFFKMTCWGDDLPTLSLEDHAPEDTQLRVGDIALFTDIQIKSYRGNVEAQFSWSASRVQLLYRRGRYFNTRDVRLKDFYPMLEWHKQHRSEFFHVSDRESSSGSQSHDSSSSTSDNSSAVVARTKIRDLRKNMVATVLCRVRELRPSESAAMGAHLVYQQSHYQKRPVEATDFDGVLLRELVMQDDSKDWMVVNLWDQHAETKFITRLLAHPGVVEIRGIVISLNALSSRLLADTTPQTQFCFVDTTTATAADRDALEVEKSLGFDPKAARPQTVYASLDELENAGSDGLLLVDNIHVERVHLGKHFGSTSRVQPQFAHLLVEGCCGVCNNTLPELELNAIPPLYGPCKKRCRSRNGTNEPLWRYRRFGMIICDARQQRLQLEAESNALVELLGNIEAEMLIRPHIDGDPHPFNVKNAVAALLNALVSDGTQTFRAEIRCSRFGSQSVGGPQRSHSIGMSQDTQNQQLNQQQPEFTLASLIASPSHHLII